MNNLEVLILCGGKGTRLKSVVSDRPKPFADIKGTPLLEYIIKTLTLQGFKNICFLTGTMGYQIKDHFNSGDAFGCHFRYSHEESPLGTGGAVSKAVQSSNFDRFLVLNGDTFLYIDFKKFTASSSRYDFCLGLREVDDASRYGAVEFEGDRILNFREKDTVKENGFINAGVYCFSKKIEEYFFKSSFSLERESFPLLIKERKLFGLEVPGEFIDIGIPEDYKRAQELIPKWLSQNEVFKPEKEF